MQEGEISRFNFDETCYAFIRKIYLMEKIGVAISVTSALGEGSAFTLTLPVVWQGSASACEPIVIRRPSDVKSTRKTSSWTMNRRRRRGPADGRRSQA